MTPRLRRHSARLAAKHEEGRSLRAAFFYAGVTRRRAGRASEFNATGPLAHPLGIAAGRYASCSVEPVCGLD
jgi:hypothetical protein